MKNRWDENTARQFAMNPLEMRVYSSRLLGVDEDLVLHGGGNTSVKAQKENLFGEPEDLLYVKGSGWDLATIEAEGFAPVRLDILKRMATLDQLSDSDMVKYQRAAMVDPAAPNPSVEAILHAIIPFTYVDHTHADAVVTITNTSNGKQRIGDLYGDRVLIIPYVMPGFELARTVARMACNLDWSQLEGMVLMNHGIFSFGKDAQQSYNRMITLVNNAENYLRQHMAWDTVCSMPAKKCDQAIQISTEAALQLAHLRKVVSIAMGKPTIAVLDNDEQAVGFSMLPNLKDIATRGPLTPDHVIRTKRIPLIVGDDIESGLSDYAHDYQVYFSDNDTGNLTCLDPAPRWAVWPGVGVVAFGSSLKNARIVADISTHTVRSIQRAEALGGWSVLGSGDIFEVEYWELEQAKLKKSAGGAVLSGQIALVTGAASGIGKACVNSLRRRGATVIALDIDTAVSSLFNGQDVLGIECDVCDSEALARSLRQGVSAFGGLDIVVSNAGMFPASQSIVDLEEESWSASIELNLSSHQRLLTAAIPYLEFGWNSAVVIVGSKNVPAPGPGAAAYSTAKAGLNQLGRVAALELAEKDIRVNIVHPNAVFDTAIWTREVLTSRAESYGISVAEYKRNNLLKTEVTSHDVAELVSEMAGPLFAKTTGAQIPVDGGNERVV